MNGFHGEWHVIMVQHGRTAMRCTENDRDRRFVKRRAARVSIRSRLPSSFDIDSAQPRLPINGFRNEIVQTPGRFIKPAVEKCKSRRDRRSHENHDGIYRSPRVLPPFSRTHLLLFRR